MSLVDPKTGSKLVPVGNGKFLRKLTPEDFLEIGNELTYSRRERLKRSLEDSEIKGEAAFKLLAEFDSQATTFRDIVQFISTPEGSAIAIRRAVQRTEGMEMDQIEITPFEMVDVALKICNFRDVDSPAPAPSRASSPVPPGNGAGQSDQAGASPVPSVTNRTETGPTSATKSDTTLALEPALTP